MHLSTDRLGLAPQKKKKNLDLCVGQHLKHSVIGQVLNLSSEEWAMWALFTLWHEIHKGPFLRLNDYMFLWYVHSWLSLFLIISNGFYALLSWDLNSCSYILLLQMAEFWTNMSMWLLSMVGRKRRDAKVWLFSFNNNSRQRQTKFDKFIQNCDHTCEQVKLKMNHGKCY